MADDPKNAHLKALPGAGERLILCKADLLDYDAICRAVQGCQGVFHTASPVTDDPVSRVVPHKNHHILQAVINSTRDADAIAASLHACNYSQEQMVEPAVRGTEFVIDAAAAAGTVRRVVFTSSIGAVTMDPSRGPDVVVDESCWSDLDFCKKTRVGASSLCPFSPRRAGILFSPSFLF